MTATFAAGALVRARDRDWVVLPASAPDMLVVRPLGGTDDDIAALFPAFEHVVGAEFAPPSPGDLGDAQAAGLLRTAMRIGFRSGAGPFRSLAGIAVQPRAYQYVPLMMALRQQTVRMLISDDVGIGKTVEAGLIAAELLAQGSAQRLAVLCSPALAEQWQGELRTKFGIDAELVLASTVARLERDLELGVSLFDKHPNVIISTDFIKSHRHRDDFVRHCPDLVIVDEAHTCVAADEKTSVQSQLRYELLQRVAADSARHLLLVTATPHSGKQTAFANLLGLLRPDLADADTSSRTGRERLAQHFVQRRRGDIRKYLDEETEFPEDRLFKDEPYTLSNAYRSLLEDAVAYASEQVKVAGERGRRESRIAWWSAIALLRSMVSSPRAAAQTLRTRSATAAAATADEADALGAPVVADSTDNDAMEGFDVVHGAQVDKPGNRLADLADRAEQLEGPDEDRKLAALIKHVKALLADGYNPIVFCRYIPTAEYVAEHLAEKVGRKAIVKAVTGTLSPQQRLQRIEDLAAASAEEADSRRVLVATDCLSEGVNLQHHFDAVVHYDLAWNPTRHDQREGRVDRYGQTRETVRVITIFGSDNGIDGKVLEVLIAKHRQIRKDLGISVSVPDASATGVTNAIMEWMLLRDKRVEQPSLFGAAELADIYDKAGLLEAEWNSTAEREKQSRSLFAQHTIRPEEVAVEVEAVRDALGDPGEVHSFVRHGLTSLDAVITSHNANGDLAADITSSPAGLRAAFATALGGNAAERPISFRASSAVDRGQAALVRTDPVVGALANYLLDSALDDKATGPRPARRCGVIRTRAVSTRTTLLLVRYRFHLTLPSRSGVREHVAEDARLLAFTGAPSSAAWLSFDDTRRLLSVTADENIDPAFAERTMQRLIEALPTVASYLDEYGVQLATDLDASHRRVRQAARDIVRGLQVSAQQPADILGAYVYLPISGAGGDA